MRVRVAASSANLGPGFDAVGLALALYDEVVVEATGAGVEVEVQGEGASGLPRDGRHLVLRAVCAALAAAGVARGGLRLRAVNAVPHGRGLGSSAAAVVAGLVAGRALAGEAGQGLDLLRLATELEGHPDNAAAALLGGLTLAWDDGGPRAVRVPHHPELRAVVAIPPGRVATSAARALLPAEVPYADAAFTAGRAALLVEALTRRPDLLVPATADRLHQDRRRPAMPASWDLVARLRGAGHAAAISGAGPSVVVLGTDSGAVRAVAGFAAPGWDVRAVEVGERAMIHPA